LLVVKVLYHSFKAGRRPQAPLPVKLFEDPRLLRASGGPSLACLGPCRLFRVIRGGRLLVQPWSDPKTGISGDLKSGETSDLIYLKEFWVRQLG
jgi:hypothetical protein